MSDKTIEEERKALNDFVAERVCGWHKKPFRDGSENELWSDAVGYQEWICHYKPTIDITQTIEAADKFGWWTLAKIGDDEYVATVQSRSNVSEYGDSTATTPALALCLALKAAAEAASCH